MARQAQKQRKVSTSGPASHNKLFGIDAVISRMSQNEVQGGVAILNLGRKSGFGAEAIINTGNGVTVPDEIFDIVPIFDSHHPSTAMYPEDQRERAVAFMPGQVE